MSEILVINLSEYPFEYFTNIGSPMLKNKIEIIDISEKGSIDIIETNIDNFLSIYSIKSKKKELLLKKITCLIYNTQEEKERIEMLINFVNPVLLYSTNNYKNQPSKLYSAIVSLSNILNIEFKDNYYIIPIENYLDVSLI